MSAVASAFTAPRVRPASFTWLRERGMGASILIAALSSGFGVILITATAYISALLHHDETIGGAGMLSIITGIMGVVLTGVAVYAAAIATANTFSTIIAGRTRQIALMRLIGASSKSERQAIARQGLGVGIIGSALGLVVGVVLSIVLVQIVSEALNVTSLDFMPVQPTVVLPAIIVALTTWAAAWVGSRRVITVTPLEALAGSGDRSRAETRAPARNGVAITLLIIGGGLLALGVVMGMRSPFGVVIAFFGGLASFSGLVLGATLIMPPLLRLVGRAFGRSVTAQMAAANALRYSERSSRMAIGVVMGVTLVTMFAVAMETVKSVMATANEGMQEAAAQALDTFTFVMMGLVGISAVIAAVGLVNLLTIGIVQRRRELALLRTLGLTSRQIRLMVLLEAAHIAVTAIAAGLLFGIAYGWAGAQSLLGSATGSENSLVMPAIPWSLVVGTVVVAVVLTLVAAVAPTRLATRVAPVAALAAD